VFQNNEIMKTENRITEAAVSRVLRLSTTTAPSLRVPVTTANRALLRWLRREELSAWEAGRLCSCGSFTTISPALSERRHA
jgi:hypothetical protein